jgi:hypothetical protein
LIKGSLPSGKGKYPFLSAVRPNFIELKTTKNNNNYEKKSNFYPYQFYSYQRLHL